MGRRLVGGVLVALGLMAASLAWVGYSASRTALDPGRSQAIADDLYQDREVRAQLRNSMATALEAALPEGVRVSRSDLVAAADRALDDPAVENLLVGGLIRAHQRFLGADPRPEEPIVVDGAAIATAARNALINHRPDLINSVPVPPSVPVELPVDRLPNAGGFRIWLNGMVAILASIAVGLIVAAFVLTNDRPRVMRRVGYWAIGASAFWIIVGFVLPELAHLLIPGAAAILAAMWGIVAGGMLEPSRNALIAGLVAVVVSFIWAAIASLAGSRKPSSKVAAERGGRPRPGTARTIQSSSRPPAEPHQPVPARAARPAPVRTPGPATPPRGVPVVHAPGAPAAPAPARPASPSHAPASSPAPVTAPSKPASSKPAAPQWVEGQGYINDPDPTQAG